MKDGLPYWGAATDRLIAGLIVAGLVVESVFSSFVRRLTRRRLMRGPLGGARTAFHQIAYDI